MGNRLKRVGLSVFLAAMIWATAAQAGWRQVEWGMTPEQAAAAMPEVAKPDRGGTRNALDGYTIGNTGPATFEGGPVRATFYYTPDGLALVSLDPPSKVKDCKPYLEALLKQYGRPLNTSDQVILKLFIWHDTATDSRVLLQASQGAFCSVKYYRLSDYEAGDRERAGLPPRT